MRRCITTRYQIPACTPTACPGPPHAHTPPHTQDQLLKSLYAVYMRTWLDAFGAHKLLVLRAEDYWRDTRGSLLDVWRFLDIGALAGSVTLAAAMRRPISVLHGSNATFWGDKKVVNLHAARSDATGVPAHSHSRIAQPMLAEARELLSRFFGPYNAELARMLQDRRFEWGDVLHSRAQYKATVESSRNAQRSKQ